MSEDTRGWFAEQVLLGIGAPITVNNISAMLAWMQGENTRAGNNPLATTLSTFDSEGATWFNTFGDQGQYHVRNYTTPEQGVEATVATLEQGYYTDIVSALRSGTNTSELETLVRESPWGTKTFGDVDSSNYQAAAVTELGTQATSATRPSYDYETSPWGSQEAVNIYSGTRTASGNTFNPLSTLSSDFTREDFFRNTLMQMEGYDSSDLSSSTDVYEAAKREGLTTQTSSTFNPDSEINRTEAALVLLRAAGEAPERGDMSWGDYSQAVLQKAESTGIYQGYGDERGLGTGNEAFQQEWYGGVSQALRDRFPGVFEGGGSGGSAPAPAPNPQALIDDSLELQRQEDAWAMAKGMLTDLGLESLFDKVKSLIISGRSAETAVMMMRFEPEYKARFRGMEERIANGYNAISPQRYLQLEDNYRNMLEQAGFDPNFIEDFGDFIANDINETEFGDRISVAMRAAEAADPVILQELQERYGIGIDTKADITMYFLDPERAVTLLEAKTQLGVAELSAATTSTIGGRLGEQTGRELVGRGYSSRELGERLKGQGSFRQRMVGEGQTSSRNGPMTSTALAAAEFGLDSEAVARLKLLRGSRSQRGIATSGAALTSSGVTGFGVAS